MSQILIVTNRYDSHVDYMINKFNEKGVGFIRFNTDDYPTIDSIDIKIDNDCGFNLGMSIHNQKLSLTDLTSVWLRRPLKHHVSSDLQDSQIKEFAQDESKALTDGLWLALSDLYWVSPLDNIRRWQHKVAQLRFAQSMGFTIPSTLITTDPNEFLEFWKRCNGHVIYKPLGANMMKQSNGLMQTAYTNKLTSEFLNNLDSIKYAPCLFQRYIEKKVELRITVVGTKVFACEIHSQLSEKTRIDWRHYDIENTPHIPVVLPYNVSDLCVKLVQTMGLEYGAIDMIVTPNGEYIFIEINPNGQWLWIEQLTNLPIGDALLNLLIRG